MFEEYKKAIELVNNASSITILTGAGVSTNSGIPDFQSIDEKWPFKESRQKITSFTYFHRNTETFWKAYKYLFSFNDNLKPNSFHNALAKLEESKTVTVITQNIDGLHQLAGSSNVITVHGNSRKLICSRPSCPFETTLEELSFDTVPKCPTCRKKIRPDVVLFEEPVRKIKAANQIARKSDLLVVAGTSLEVYPISEIPLERFKSINKPSIWLNKHPAPQEYNFTVEVLGDLDETRKIFENS